MIVKDLVETRELLTEEMSERAFVVYERFENVDCHCEGDKFEEIECDPEEQIQILVGSPVSTASLKSVKTYLVGDTFSTIDEIIADIRLNHKDLFKTDNSLLPLG
ncbi:hypothetical protein CR194_02410 [Salipaludibacillus keqinensis]|uniref:Uncharacterized protein n=1 Tax=Salipaludibacillus keqinensis TaxID=2045207 RepID=A0A323TXQ5_9BACI|nr:hypothetical protein [Salipaludibacillus keqinensis]PYZ94405.1 hypothetical protein CR194_02410 [Salipaludibacillus keqinensis]